MHPSLYTIDIGKFPLFTDPSPGYHGLKFWEVFGGEKVCISCVLTYSKRLSEVVISDKLLCAPPLQY